MSSFMGPHHLPPFNLTPEQWACLQPLLPPPSPFLRGRPPLDDRLILSAVLWKLATGSPWYHLPASYPSHQTCYRRYLLWRRLGLLEPVIRTLLVDLSQRGGLDIRAAIQTGSVTIRSDPPFFIFADLAGDTWQLDTARLLLALTYSALHRANRRLHPRRKSNLFSI